ncbi:MAG: SLATT domain-containing protein [Bacteroidota bacterium]
MDQLMAQINAQYNKTIEEANGQAKWYADNKKAKQWWSKVIRSGSIVLVGLGGIFPLIGNSLDNQHNISNWGFICIALAGTLLFLDKFFGFSSGWIRYVLTEMDIRKQAKEFELRWQVEVARLGNCGPDINCDKYIELLNLLKDFSTQIDTLVKQETALWASEFQTNISDLQKMASAKAEELRPGSIKITVKNRAEYESISIRVGGLEKKQLTGSEALIDGISPGSYEVILSGKNKNSEEKKIAAVVVVEANKMATVEMTMP